MLMLFDHFVSADDNGLGRTPPMGWRSWNFYQCNINQHIMESSFRLLADRSRLVDGIPTSLVDLGYVDAGLDDCWQLCGQYGSLNYTYHNSSGWPQVNFSRFPSMAGMVDVAHSFGLRAGFYSNNCKCKDHCSPQHANHLVVVLGLTHPSYGCQGWPPRLGADLGFGTKFIPSGTEVIVPSGTEVVPSGTEAIIFEFRGDIHLWLVQPNLI